MSHLQPTFIARNKSKLRQSKRSFSPPSTPASRQKEKEHLEDVKMRAEMEAWGRSLPNFY